MKFTLELALGDTVKDYRDIAAVLRNVADDVEEPSEPPEITGPCEGRILSDPARVIFDKDELAAATIGRWAVVAEPETRKELAAAAAAHARTCNECSSDSAGRRRRVCPEAQGLIARLQHLADGGL